jgi:hypothetical protein
MLFLSGAFAQKGANDEQGAAYNPLPPILHSVEPATQFSNDLKLNFTIQSFEGFDYYSIFRSTTPVRDNAYEIYSYYSELDSFYIDKDYKDSETTYYYWMQSYDLNESSSSNSDSVFTKTETPIFDNYNGEDLPYNLTNGDIAWADVDGDGDLDFIVTGNYLENGEGTYQDESETRLYLNNGEGFSRVYETSFSGVSSSSVDFADYNGDGDIDVIITGIYMQGSSEGKKGQVFKADSATTTIYRNAGEGSFVEAVNLPGIHEGAAKFGDFNNDGFPDVFLTGMMGESHEYAYISKLFINNQDGSFTDQVLELPALAEADVSVGDVDNDGDLDVVMNGANSEDEIKTILLINTNGILAPSPITLTGTVNGSIEFGDYDNDGDLDILSTGYSPINVEVFIKTTYLHTNNGASFSEIRLDSVVNGEARFGDYDGDGDLDFVVVGEIEVEDIQIPQKNKLRGQPMQSPFVFRLYENQNGTFVHQEYQNESDFGRTAAFVEWVDYNNDGKLDLSVIGEKAGFYYGDDYKNSNENSNSGSTLFLQNQFVTANTRPVAPNAIVTTRTGADVTFSWNAGTDSETPINGLSYNIAVFNSQNINMPNSLSNSAGERSVMKIGNVGQNTSWTLKNLPEDSYTWSVQTVDAGKRGSAFAEMKAFVVDTTPPPARASFGAYEIHGGVDLTWNTSGSIPDFFAYIIYQDNVPVDSIFDRGTGYLSLTNLTIGQVYSFRLSTVDVNGNEAFSNTTRVIEILDLEAPDAITGLNADVRTNALLLSWDQSTAEDFMGYIIYVGHQQIGKAKAENKATRIGPIPIDTIFNINEDSTLLSGLTNGQSYDFAVSVMDTAGNVNQLYAEVTATPQDVDPPEMPQNFHAEIGDKQAILRWDANSEVDFSYYLLINLGDLGVQSKRGSLDLKKATEIETVDVDTITDINVDSLLLTNLTNDSAYTYIMVAVDTAGNGSDVAGPLSFTPTNEAPTITMALADTTILEDAEALTFNWHNVFDDKESADEFLALTYTNPTTLVDISVEGAFVIVTPKEDAFGVETLTFTAEDQVGQTVSESLVLTILPVNDAPIGPVGISRLDTLEDFGSMIIPLNFFTDVETTLENMTFSVSPSFLVTTVFSGTLLEITSVPNAFGVDTVYLTATDEGGLSVTDTAIITLAPINDQPIVENPIGNMSIIEDFTPLTYNLRTVFQDVETSDEDLLLSVTTSSLVTTSIENGILTISSILNKNGIDTLKITASDGDLSTEDKVVLQVNSVDDYPVLSNPLADLTVPEDTPARTINLQNVFSDVDGEFSVSILSSEYQHISTSEVSDNQFTLTFNTDAYGSDTIIVAAVSLGKVLMVATYDTMVVNITPVTDPVSISTIDIGENQLTVHWNKSPEIDVKEYYIAYTSIRDAATHIVAASDTMLTIKNLKNNESYAFTVQVSDEMGHLSTVSESVSATPLDMTAPNKLVLTSVDEGDKKVTLNWSPSNAADFETYFFYVKTGSAAFTRVDSSTTKSQTSYDVTGLNNLQSYTFAITAKDTNGNESVLSNELSAIPEGLEFNTYFFQNQLIHEEIQFNLQSNLILTDIPNYTVSGPKGTVDVTVTHGSVADGKQVSIGRFSADSAGTYTFTAEGAASNGRIASYTRQLTLSSVFSSKRAVIVSADQAASLSLSSNSFAVKHTLMLQEDLVDEHTYRFIAPEALEKEAKITFNITAANFSDYGKLFVYQNVNGKWEALETQVYVNEMSVVAKVKSLGDFKIAVDASFNGNNTVPNDFSVSQNYPNPFNPITNISYNLPSDQHISIVVFNALGQKVRVLLDGIASAGQNKIVTWRGENDHGQKVASGIYFYQVITRSKTITKKMVLMK